MLKKAVDCGSLKALHLYGTLLTNGFLVKKNENKGIELIKMAADKGHAKSLYDYASYLNDINKKIPYYNNPESVNCLKKAADLGNVSSMDLYASVIILKGDENLMKKALQLIQKASIRGNIFSMHIYGLLLIQGQRVKPNPILGLKYVKIAADNGVNDALFQYGTLIENHNKQEAIKYYKMAIDQGHPSAMHRYANMLSSGDGVDKNIEEAARYY